MPSYPACMIGSWRGFTDTRQLLSGTCFSSDSEPTFTQRSPSETPQRHPRHLAYAWTTPSHPCARISSSCPRWEEKSIHNLALIVALSYVSREMPFFATLECSKLVWLKCLRTATNVHRAMRFTGIHTSCLVREYQTEKSPKNCQTYIQIWPIESLLW